MGCTSANVSQRCNAHAGQSCVVAMQDQLAEDCGGSGADTVDNSGGGNLTVEGSKNDTLPNRREGPGSVPHPGTHEFRTVDRMIPFVPDTAARSRVAAVGR